MKNVRTTFALAAVLAAGLVPAMRAQQAPTNSTPAPAAAPMRHMREPLTPEQRADRIAARLKLSDEQKSKLAPIFADQQTKLAALREDKTLTPREKFHRAQVLRDDSHRQLRAILTDEQRLQLLERRREIRADMRDHRQEMRDHRAAFREHRHAMREHARAMRDHQPNDAQPDAAPADKANAPI